MFLLRCPLRYIRFAGNLKFWLTKAIMKFIQLRFHYQRGRRRVFDELINHKIKSGFAYSELSYSELSYRHIDI